MKFGLSLDAKSCSQVDLGDRSVQIRDAYR